MRVVVTGIAGLLGSHVASSLLDDGHEVVGIDNFTGGYRSNIPEGAELYEVDARNFEAMCVILQDAHVVFNAACTAYEGLSVFSPNFVTSNTFGLTVSVATAAARAGVRRLVQCSSMARYGTQATNPFTEDMIPRPQDPYGIAKVGAEQVLTNISAVHGMEVVILVPHNIYGPGQMYDDPYRNVAAIMVNRILHDRPPVIYGDGSQVRCLTHISDAVDPIRRSLEAPGLSGEVINIGPDKGEVTILHLAEVISDIMGWDGGFVHFPGRPQEVHHATCSANKARALLGYETRVSLEAGLRDLINWIRNQPRRDFRYERPIELLTGDVPETWVKGLI